MARLKWLKKQCCMSKMLEGRCKTFIWIFVTFICIQEGFMVLVITIPLFCFRSPNAKCALLRGCQFKEK